MLQSAPVSAGSAALPAREWSSRPAAAEREASAAFADFLAAPDDGASRPVDRKDLVDPREDAADRPSAPREVAGRESADGAEARGRAGAEDETISEAGGRAPGAADTPSADAPPEADAAQGEAGGLPDQAAAKSAGADMAPAPLPAAVAVLIAAPPEGGGQPTAGAAAAEAASVGTSGGAPAQSNSIPAPPVPLDRAAAAGAAAAARDPAAPTAAGENGLQVPPAESGSGESAARKTEASGAAPPAKIAAEGSGRSHLSLVEAGDAAAKSDIKTDPGAGAAGAESAAALQGDRKASAGGPPAQAAHLRPVGFALAADGGAKDAASLPQSQDAAAPQAAGLQAANAASSLMPALTAPGGVDASAPTGHRTPLPDGVSVPIAGLAAEIAARAIEGKRRFEIRLDPPELGRIDVRLDIGREGQVTSRLIVERAETLDLLRRDAHALEQTLQSAGLRTDGGGLQFSLRQQPGAQPQPWEGAGSPKVLILPDADVAVQEAVRRGYSVLRGLGRGVDIRV